MKISLENRKVLKNTRNNQSNEIYSKLDAGGFLRLWEVLMLIPVSKSTWWDGIAQGHFPKGIKLTPRTTAWRASDIKKIIEEFK